ncbi:MAG: BrnT family toxin [Gammaproteobacteria bacterium]
MSDIVYDFQWDAAKALSNADKHGVTFEQAASVFLDPLALTVFDEAHSHDEERWWLLGHDARGALLLVAHTYQATGPTSASVRLISARPATRRERHFYENEPR